MRRPTVAGLARQDAIAAYLRNDWSSLHRIADVAAAVGCNYAHARLACERLTKAGVVERVEGFAVGAGIGDYRRVDPTSVAYRWVATGTEASGPVDLERQWLLPAREPHDR